jgi:hypothetical protein
MTINLEGDKESVTLQGVVRSLPTVSYSPQSMETFIEVECEPAAIRGVEDWVKKVQGKFVSRFAVFNTLFAPTSKTIRELRFIGVVHEDIIGEPFSFTDTVQAAYDGFKQYAYTTQLLSIPSKHRKYVSEYLIPLDGQEAFFRMAKYLVDRNDTKSGQKRRH